MSVTEVTFLVFSGIAIAGALGVVLARNVVYASLFLLLALLAVAGIYVLIFSPFLALVQVLIYGGAITVVVLFALMLTRQRELGGTLDNRQKPAAALVGLGAMGVLIATVVANKWPATVTPQATDYRQLGAALFSKWAVPFEIASVLLLVALIGAIVISRPGERS